MRPGAASTPLQTSTPPGRRWRHRLGHVVGAQSARDDQAVVVRHALGQAPVEDLARPRVLAVHEQEVRAELLEAHDGAIPRRERLDHGGHAGADPLRLLGGLVPVHLGGAQSRHPDGFHDPLRRLVAEDADGQHVLGQPLGDVPGQVHRDLPR